MTIKKVNRGNTLKFEILNNIGVISDNNKGWQKELNRVSWNGGEPKYDIRDWDATHEKMGKGTTLTEQELRELKKIIDKEIELIDNN